MRFPSLLGILLACQAAVSANANELAFATQQFPPFNYRTNGGHGAGPMADVVKTVCARTRTQCSITVFPWRRALKMAESGEIDGIFSILPTTERKAAYHLSEPVMESAYSFFAPDSSTFRYRQPSDLDGYVVAVYGPSGTHTALDELLKSGTTAKPVIEIDNLTVLKKLAAGRYGDDKKALAAMNRDVGLYLMKTENISGIKPTGDFMKIAYCIGFPKQKVSERQFTEFNDALKELIREGKVRTILSLYGMKPAN